LAVGQAKEGVVRKSRRPTDGERIVARTTIFLTDVLDHNLDLLCLESGRPKGDLIREGIERVLVEHGYDPKVKATLKVEHKE
jgi:predicted DNA-binding protein